MTPQDVLTASTRSATRQDLPFIFDSYWRSYIEYAGRPKNTQLQRLRDRMSLLWLRATFIVATDPSDTEQILGWICFEGSVVHYVYVKSAFRRQGIARTLFAAAGLTSAVNCTHWTAAASEISARHEGVLRCVTLDCPIHVEVFNEPQAV